MEEGPGAGGLQVVHLDVQVHLHLLVAGAGGQAGQTWAGSAWNDSPAPPPGGRRVTQSGSSRPGGHPSSCW
jgi:hypothetical protein